MTSTSKRRDMNLGQLWARALMEELRRSGLKDAVVCPGSRSAPLALACADQLRVHSLLDERSAAFFALGLAKSSGRPVAVLATSGSAGAHFLPAVIEASYGQVPLVVLTADRPWELHGWGAPQTIAQERLFGPFCRFSEALSAPECSDAALLHLRAVAGRAAAVAQAVPRGPVHLNVPFREPLAPVPDENFRPQGLSALALEGRGEAPLTSTWVAPPEPPAAALDAVASALARSSRGVIVCGPMDEGAPLGQALAELSEHLGYPLFAEAASQVRFNHPGSAIVHYDAILRSAPFAQAQKPEVVLRFGGGATSKVLQAWLEGAGAFTVQFGVGGADPSHAAVHWVGGDALSACRRLVAELPAARTSPYRRRFMEAERRAKAALSEAMSGQRLTEPGVAKRVCASLPSGTNLFLASSMPIRDVDAFADEGAHLRVFCNRGANGIDGLVSTALGIAAGSQAPTVLLAGDLAVLHDLGGLLAARRAQASLTVVVVNNDGGGIFSFLPIAAAPHFEALFATPQGADFSKAAAFFDFEYARASSLDGLRASLQRALGGGRWLIEVPIERKENVAEHERLWSRVDGALGEEPWD